MNTVMTSDVKWMRVWLDGKWIQVSYTSKQEYKRRADYYRALGGIVPKYEETSS